MLASNPSTGLHAIQRMASTSPLPPQWSRLRRLWDFVAFVEADHPRSILPSYGPVWRAICTTKRRL